MEEFSGECLGPNSCDDCIIASYVKDKNLDDDQQMQLGSAAIAAQHLFMLGKGRDETIWQLARHPASGSMNVEDIQAAVDGAIMWYANDCHDEHITPQTQEGKFVEPISSEEARTVELPINPISRMRRLGELAAGFRVLPRTGALAALGLPEVKTRRHLVKLAEKHESPDDLAKRIVIGADYLEKQGEELHG